MKLTLRMKRAILQAFILNIIFLLVLSIIILFQVLPRYMETRLVKFQLYELTQRIDQTQREWLAFWQFKNLALKSQDIDAYTSSVINVATKDFYDTTITHRSGSWSFENHIESLESKVDNFKRSDEYIQRQESLGIILPTYTPEESQWLRQRDFVNYIERILYSFNLSRKWEIGIGSIQPLEDTSQKNSKTSINTENNLQEEIFYIPLDFELTWQKKDIFDFLHFFENVGSISYDDGMITVYDDNLLDPISGESEDKNIYKSQIADIVSLEASRYPDSSSFANISWESGLLNLLRWAQSRERYDVGIELRFFVSGLPSYSMEEYILSTIELWEMLWENIPRDYAKAQNKEREFVSGAQLQALQTLWNLSILMSNMQEEIQKFKASFLKKENILKSYSEAIVLERQLSRIDFEYENAIIDLQIK